MSQLPSFRKRQLRHLGFSFSSVSSKKLEKKNWRVSCLVLVFVVGRFFLIYQLCDLIYP